VAVGDVLQYACGRLGLSRSTTPEGKERILVDHLLHCCANQPRSDQELSQAMLILRKTASRWHDARLFLRAVEVCKADTKISIMGVEGFIWAYRACGFELTRTM
jgi:hypothetical protein